MCRHLIIYACSLERLPHFITCKCIPDHCSYWDWAESQIHTMVKLLFTSGDLSKTQHKSWVTHYNKKILRYHGCRWNVNGCSWTEYFHLSQWADCLGSKWGAGKARVFCMRSEVGHYVCHISSIDDCSAPSSCFFGLQSLCSITWGIGGELLTRLGYLSPSSIPQDVVAEKWPLSSEILRTETNSAASGELGLLWEVCGIKKWSGTLKAGVPHCIAVNL